MKLELLAIVTNTNIVCNAKEKLQHLIMGCSDIEIDGGIGLRGKEKFVLSINEKDISDSSKYYSLGRVIKSASRQWRPGESRLGSFLPAYRNVWQLPYTA